MKKTRIYQNRSTSKDSTKESQDEQEGQTRNVIKSLTPRWATHTMENNYRGPPTGVTVLGPTSGSPGRGSGVRKTSPQNSRLCWPAGPQCWSPTGLKAHSAHKLSGAGGPRAKQSFDRSLGQTYLRVLESLPARRRAAAAYRGHRLWWRPYLGATGAATVWGPPSSHWLVSTRPAPTQQPVLGRLRLNN